jgi:hypothetical protein
MYRPKAKEDKKKNKNKYPVDCQQSDVRELLHQSMGQRY